MERLKRTLHFAYALAHALVELGGDLLDAARDRRSTPEGRDCP